MANLVLGAGGAAADDYTIDQSLRFDDGDSAYLSRTPGSAGNQTQFTLSVWVKRANTGSAVADGYESCIFSSGGGAGNRGAIRFYDDELDAAYYNGAWVWEQRTTAKFRDPGAWYHIVVSLDTVNQEGKIYVNGEEITAFNTDTVPGSSLATSFNSTVEHLVGARAPAANGYFDGELAEMYWIDGTIYDADDFGETDTTTNQWKPKDASGLTFGTNGFYLKFQDSSALGDDSSGNTNDFTATNLVATDQMVDSPTNNFSTMNPLDKYTSNVALSEGNLKFVKSSSNFACARGTFGMSSGKWYFEGIKSADTDIWQIGVSNGFDIYQAGGDISVSGTGGIGAAWDDRGYIYRTGGNSNTVDGFDEGDIISVAFDVDTGKIWFAKNGVWQFSGDPAAGTTPAFTASGFNFLAPFTCGENGGGGTFNFGSDSSFAGAVTAQGNQDGNGVGDFYYAPPTDFLALCTSNLSDPEIKLSGDNFNTILYSGDDANPRTLTGVGFQADFSWIKSRTGAYSHQLFDAVRGAGEALYSNNTEAQYSDSATGHLSAWTADGYTVSGSSNTEELNDTGQDYVAWNWLANGSGVANTVGGIASTVSVNSSAGFSIVKYTGEASQDTVGHGLSEAPTMVIIKRSTGGTGNWITWASPLTNGNWCLVLNTAGAQVEAGWAGTTAVPTATTFSVANNSDVNASGADYISYCFHSVEGYSKIGSFEGNSNADGTFIYTGMKPAWLILKNVDGGAEWYMSDNNRSPYNVVQGLLLADQATAEDDDFIMVDYVSNGFKVRSSDSAFNTNTVLYIAFAESPFKYANAR